jgi:hypothetical protein
MSGNEPLSGELAALISHAVATNDETAFLFPASAGTPRRHKSKGRSLGF